MVDWMSKTEIVNNCKTKPSK